MQALSAALAGLQLALVPEIEAYWLENSTSDSQNGSTTATYLPEKNLTPKQKPKRYQVGSIEERISNPKRPNPCTCYYFCWNEKDDDGKWRKRKVYIPQNQMSQVWQACKVERFPYWETLKLIRKSPKLHHTDTPKL